MTHRFPAVILLLAVMAVQPIASAETAHVLVMLPDGVGLPSTDAAWTKWATAVQWAIAEASSMEAPTQQALNQVGSIAVNDVYPVNSSTAALTLACDSLNTAKAAVELTSYVSYNPLRKLGVLAARLTMPAAPPQPRNGVPIWLVVVLSLLCGVAAAGGAMLLMRHTARKAARGVAFQELVKLEAELFAATDNRQINNRSMISHASHSHDPLL
jgi:hypothetical protein